MGDGWCLIIFILHLCFFGWCWPRLCSIFWWLKSFVTGYNKLDLLCNLYIKPFGCNMVFKLWLSCNVWRCGKLWIAVVEADAIIVVMRLRRPPKLFCYLTLWEIMNKCDRCRCHYGRDAVKESFIIVLVVACRDLKPKTLPSLFIPFSFFQFLPPLGSSVVASFEDGYDSVY